MALLGLLLLLVGFDQRPQPATAIVIHVATEQRVSPEGFVEPIPKVATDAANELAKQLRKYKGLSVSPEPVGSDVRVTLTGVSFESEPAGAVVYPVGRMVVARPRRITWASVRVELAAGEYRKEIITTDREWKTAVTENAKEIVEWLNANRIQLLERRPQK